MVEETLEFLEDVIEDTTDVYQGHLSIDMDMANAKDIDDGQTVTGMLDEMQEREQQLKDAIIIYKSAKTHVKEKRSCKSFSLVGFLQEQPIERREHANSCCHHQAT